MIERELINQPTERFPSCHCSTIVELPSGDLLAAWYAGSAESRPDVAVVTSRKPKSAKAWEPCQIVSDTPGKPEGNCVLFVAPDEKLWIFFAVMHGKLDGPPGPGVRWETCDLRCKTSTDEGRTWSETRMLREELGMVARCKPIVLKNGDIIMGFEHKDGYSYFMISENMGETWFWTGPLLGVKNQHPTLIQRVVCVVLINALTVRKAHQRLRLMVKAVNEHKANEKDGSILALLRPSDIYRRIGKSISLDNGRTWSPAVNTDLPNPHAAIDMVKLTDGRVVLAFNNDEHHRNPLTLALSEDEGETWKYMRDVVTGEGNFSYPAIIEDRERLLHLTYTHNRRHIGHITLTPDWIME